MFGQHQPCKFSKSRAMTRSWICEFLREKVVCADLLPDSNSTIVFLESSLQPFLVSFSDFQDHFLG